MAAEETSYIDYDTFLDPNFSATSFANDLVLSTNDPNDTPLDLSTPLSRVLFDVQEVDIHIDNLTTRSAVPLLEYTQTRADASSRILDEVSAQLESLNEGYKRLEKDVIERHERAEQTRLAAERLCQTLKLGRVVSRCMNLGRQLETQMEDLGITPTSTSTSSALSSASTAAKVRENHRSMVAASQTILELRSILTASPPVPDLHRISNVTLLRNNLLTPLERSLTSLAQSTIREFSVSSLPAPSNLPPQLGGPNAVLSPTSANAATFAQTEQAKSRTTSALRSLYLLSPVARGTPESRFEPKLLLAALTAYLQANLTASLASLARALATLPTLDRTLGEVAGRCANVVALEGVLASARRGAHPWLVGAPAAAAASERNGVPAVGNGNRVESSEDDDADDDDDDWDESDDEGDDDEIEQTTAQHPARSKSAQNGTKAAAKLTKASSKNPQKETQHQHAPSRVQQSQDQPLLPLLLHALDTNSLPSYFWRTLASNLTARVIEILNRGGVSARTLRSNRERVAAAVRECVLKTGRAEGGSVPAGRGRAGAAEAGVKGARDGRAWEREAAVMVGSIVGVLGRG